jgi:hypothetical protein
LRASHWKYPKVLDRNEFEIYFQYRMYRLASGLVSMGLFVGLARPAVADRRSFTNTYEYTTVPEGRTAIELWHTESRDTWDASTPQRFQEIIEIEHGLTDHWDAAFYTTFGQVSADDPMTTEAMHLSDIRLETRYRLADRGEWPVDTLLYLEVSKAFGASQYEFEGKVIGARDFDKLTVAANAIAATKVGHDVPESEIELAWAVGASYEPHPKIRLGAETWGQHEDGATAAWAGPAINVAPSGGFWLTFTAGFGVTDAADKFVGRAILGIEL